MNRRSLFGRLLVGAVAVVSATAATSVEAACGECERVFSMTLTVPDTFDKGAATESYLGMARRSVHEMAIREGVSHDEAGMRLWWDAFPALVEVPAGASPVSGYELTLRNQGTGGKYLRIYHDNGTVKAEFPERTFEAMQADCEARGCVLDFKHANGGPSTHVLTHVQREPDGETRWAGFDYWGEGTEQWLAHVDAWRKSLHT